LDQEVLVNDAFIEFFSNLAGVYDKHNFQCQDIYEVCETAVKTVIKPTRMAAKKSVRLVGAVSSAEKRSMVAMTVAESACGISPQFFECPRKNYWDYFIAKGPDGNSGSANMSALITGDDFVSYMEYHIKHIRAAKNKSVLLLLDNYRSYLDIKVLDLVKKKG
jgi:hypothetical protein